MPRCRCVCRAAGFGDNGTYPGCLAGGGVSVMVSVAVAVLITPLTGADRWTSTVSPSSATVSARIGTVIVALV